MAVLTLESLHQTLATEPVNWALMLGMAVGLTMGPEKMFGFSLKVVWWWTLRCLLFLMSHFCVCVIASANPPRSTFLRASEVNTLHNVEAAQNCVPLPGSEMANSYR